MTERKKKIIALTFVLLMAAQSALYGLSVL